MLDVTNIRRQFPALQESYNGRPAIFFDNPGGTQVPQQVIGAMVDCLTRRNANTHGLFETSARADAIIEGARQAAADLLGAQPDEIVFDDRPQQAGNASEVEVVSGAAVGERFEGLGEPLEIEASGDSLCVVARSLNDSGQQSSDTAPACSD